MKWIQNFLDSKIPFYIYQLNKGDYLTYTMNNVNNRCLIILDGITYINKVFTNKEIIILGILQKDDFIQEVKSVKYYNYSIVALQKTFLISFAWKDVINNKYIKVSLIIDILNAYKKTLYKYEAMSNILLHKSAKHRVIQLLLFLCKEFCIIENNSSIIPFHISQIAISRIIGTNKNSVNHIMNQLYKLQVISYEHNRYISIQNAFKLSYCYNNPIN